MCADDYAISPGVSRGILEAAEAGAISATSAMTTMPRWPEWAPPLRSLAAERLGRLDVGLHLNLTVGAPLGPMPTFAPGGVLPSIGDVARRALKRLLPSNEIEAEIERQLDRFAIVFGAPPSHIDGHQHVHALPIIRDVMLAALRKRNWTPWIRDPADRLRRIAQRPGARLKALAVSALARGLRRSVARAGLTTNDGFSGFSSFQHPDYAHEFGSALVAAGRRHLVMCHPGWVDGELAALDPVTGSRERELRFLLSPGFRDLLARHNATVASLSAMPPRPPSPG